MYILDEKTDKSIKKIILYLTYSEASELKDSLENLLRKPLNNHEHISNEDFKKEITICIYDVNNLNGLNDRSINLIKKDK